MIILNIFLDTEFTGLQKNTSLISIGIVDESNNKFYAEFTDYDKDFISSNNWLKKNVIDKLWINNKSLILDDVEYYFGDKETIRLKLEKWLSKYKEVTIWADCLAYDWVLFCDIFDGALNIPSNINYIPMDLATLFKVKGLNPDIDRFEFSGLKLDVLQKHNALFDAIVIKTCYEKLIKS